MTSLPDGVRLELKADRVLDVDGILLDSESNLTLDVKSVSGCVVLGLEGERALEEGEKLAIPLGDIHASIPRFEIDGECSRIHVWVAVPREGHSSMPDREESTKRLRALGYIH